MKEKATMELIQVLIADGVPFVTMECRGVVSEEITFKDKRTGTDSKFTVHHIYGERGGAGSQIDVQTRERPAQYERGTKLLVPLLSFEFSMGRMMAKADSRVIKVVEG